MLKNTLIYLLLSLLVVVFARYIHLLSVYLDMSFITINYHLSSFFSNASWGIVLRKTLILMAIPLILVGLTALLYRQIKGKNLPHMLASIWIIWTIMVLSDILIR